MIRLLDECTTGPWITSGLDVQYKLVNGILSFQHTVSKSDWLFNFFYVPVKDRLGRLVHGGFNNLLESVMPEIPTGDVHTVIGFSQGGALAQLYSSWFNARCVTFAAPRPFVLPFDNGHIHRFEKRGDIVPWMPPWCFPAGSVRKIGRWSMPSINNHYIEAYRASLDEQ